MWTDHENKKLREAHKGKNKKLQCLITFCAISLLTSRCFSKNAKYVAFFILCENIGVFKKKTKNLSDHEINGLPMQLSQCIYVG